VEAAETVYNKHVIKMTISVGVAVADANTPTTYEQLRDVAAEALKEAKQSGRNRGVLRVVATPPAVQ
jgi:GGDEF domain-containing protein